MKHKSETGRSIFVTSHTHTHTHTPSPSILLSKVATVYSYSASPLSPFVERN